MGKRSRIHRSRLGKDQAGCMWGLIHIFDFRHGSSTRKLLLNKKRGSKHPVDVEYPEAELKMLTYYDDKRASTEDLQENELAKGDGLRTSVKELMEEEMFGEQASNNNRNSASETPKQAEKHQNRSHTLHMDGAENSSNLGSIKNLDLEVILKELCQLNKTGSSVKHDWIKDVDIKSNQVCSLVEENLGEAIKVLINQRFCSDKHQSEDGKTNLHSKKELIDALEMLSLNKELCFELLQDPNSLLVKQIQCVKNAQLDKDIQNTSLSLRHNLLEEEQNKARPVELTNQKHRNFFRRRRSKSQDSNSLKDTENVKPSSRIIIFKPGGPAALQNSGSESITSTSKQSQQTMDNKPQSERNSLQFSLNEIKRKLKHAMGKERHGKFSSEFQNLKNHEKGVSNEGIGGWSSPNRNHFYTERFSKSPLGVKRGEKNGKSKEFEEIMVNQMTDNPKVTNMYVEAKKHLSDLLSIGDEKEEELMSMHLPKTLGRILSLPEYNFSSRASLPKQNSEGKLSISYDKPDDKLQCQYSNPDSPCELNYHDDLVEGNISSTAEEKGCEVEMETIRTTDMDGSHEPSSSSFFSREIHILGTLEVYNEEISPKCVKLNSPEDDIVSSSSPMSPPNPSLMMKDENHDTFSDEVGRPSPISVLEPLFAEEDISPSSIKLRPAIQPLQIHFEEHAFSNIDQAVCTRARMENEESAFEYVEAVLLGSGLNWDEYLLRWIASEQVLDPSLFDEVELFSSRSSHDQKLLFDCTNKVLEEVCEHYFGHSFGKQNVRPVPKGMTLINEVWNGVEWHILHHPAPHSLDQIIRKDMAKPRRWMDFHCESDHIVVELENLFLEEMMEDTILSFDKDNTENKLSVLLDDSIKDEESAIISL